MKFLPVVERELRVTARRPATYWLRFGAVVIMLAIWAFVQMAGRNRASSQLSLQLLHSMSALMLGFSMLAGVFLTSDCISREKRDGTLGLLFLTTLRSWDIVLGKFAASSATAIMGLMAAVPTLALPILMGGVNKSEVLRLAGVLVLTLLFGLSQGMFISVLAKDSRIAVGGTFLLGLVIAGVLPALWHLQNSTVEWPSLDWLLLPSPAFAYLKAFDTHYGLGDGPFLFWSSMLTIGALGVVMMAVSCLLLAWLWRDREAAPKAARPAPVLAARGHRKAQLLDVNPFHWLVLGDNGSSRLVGRALWVLVPIWFTMLVISINGQAPIRMFVTCLLTAFGLHVLLKVIIAIEASRRFSEDRRSGALELLLVTPLSINQILSGQTRSLWAKFRFARITLLLVNAALVFTVISFGPHLRMSGFDQMIFSAMFIGGAIALAIDSKAIPWVGMAAALRNVRHYRAVLATSLKLLIPSWLVVFLLIAGRPPIDDKAMFKFVLFWHTFGAVVAMVMTLSARKRLTRHFRRLATQP